LKKAGERFFFICDKDGKRRFAEMSLSSRAFFGRRAPLRQAKQAFAAAAGILSPKQ
jgi:hypothetical protein